MRIKTASVLLVGLLASAGLATLPAAAPEEEAAAESLLNVTYYYLPG